jgi:phosphoglycolate phosphatase-like HAD superfamily hydrolase
MDKGDLNHNDFQAILFDLDGTLLDTLADIGDSVNSMLDERGFPGHTLDDYRRFIGNGIQMLVTRALPSAGRSDEMIRACVDRAREIYWQNWNRKTRPYPGIMDLLGALETKKVPKAVLSNKPHDFTVRYVDAYFPDATFLTVKGQNDHFPTQARSGIGPGHRAAGRPAAVIVSLCGGQRRGHADRHCRRHACGGGSLGVQGAGGTHRKRLPDPGEPCAAGNTVPVLTRLRQFFSRRSLFDGVSGLFPGFPATGHVFHIFIPHAAKRAGGQTATSAGLAVYHHVFVLVGNLFFDFKLQEPPGDIHGSGDMAHFIFLGFTTV